MPSLEAKRGRQKLLIATALIALLFVIDLISGGVVRSLIQQVSSSAWRATSAIESTGIFTSRASLEREDQLLTQQVIDLQGKAALASADEAEITNLQHLVHLVNMPHGAHGISAPVISSIDTSPYGTFEIGAGSQDGLQSDDLVLSPDGFVVGELAQVEAHQSLVEELFAPKGTQSVTIDGIPVTLRGEGGGNAQGSVPQGATIVDGDAALSPSLWQLPIGIVGNVGQNIESSSYTIFVRVPTNLDALAFVYVEQPLQ